MKNTHLSAAALALATAVPAGAQNLVANGNFSAGNTSFTSSYTYSPGLGAGGPADTYTVADNPRQWNGNFVQVGDHTTGTGLMMIVNGGPVANAIVWQSSPIAISALTNYFFEAYVLNAFGSNPPILSFTVSLNGGAELPLNTLSVPSTIGVWNGLSTSFNSGAATTATLFLRNAQTADFGNDFAVDDIYLGTRSVVNPGPGPGAVPEPATWAMMLLGFGGVGHALRRRPKQARIRFA